MISPPLRADDAYSHFSGGRGYLNACSMGIPTTQLAAVMRDDVTSWERGEVSPPHYARAVEDTRTLYAGIVGTSVDRVAIATQTSVVSALLAAAVPTGRGKEVLCVDGDFSSMVFPFLVTQNRGYSVRHVALADLASEIGPDTFLVAFSLIQSVDGAVADVGAIRAAAAAHGALTYCDLTQAAGTYPVCADDFDATICNAYKWLICPRGVAFLTISEALQRLTEPTQAGWYAGESVMESFYGPGMELAASARRYDVSPAFPCWVGAREALGFFSRLDLQEVWARNSALGDLFCERAGLAPQGQAIVTVDDPERRLFDAICDAGMKATHPNGLLRLSFHLWNDEEDAIRAAGVVNEMSVRS